jgi:hypothetical protein
MSKAKNSKQKVADKPKQSDLDMDSNSDSDSNVATMSDKLKRMSCEMDSENEHKIEKDKKQKDKKQKDKKQKVQSSSEKPEEWSYSETDTLLGTMKLRRNVEFDTFFRVDVKTREKLYHKMRVSVMYLENGSDDHQMTTLRFKMMLLKEFYCQQLQNLAITAEIIDDIDPKKSETIRMDDRIKEFKNVNKKTKASKMTDSYILNYSVDVSDIEDIYNDFNTQFAELEKIVLASSDYNYKAGKTNTETRLAKVVAKLSSYLLNDDYIPWFDHIWGHDPCVGVEI